MSANGPRGVGVARFSHDPRRTRRPTSAPNARTSVVFPTPASPATKTSRPPCAEAEASAASRSPAREASSSAHVPLLPASGFKPPAGPSGGDRRTIRGWRCAAAARTELVERGASARAPPRGLRRRARGRGAPRLRRWRGRGRQDRAGAAVRRRARRAASVLWGGCDPLLTPPPLGPILEIAAHAPSVVTEAIRPTAEPTRSLPRSSARGRPSDAARDRAGGPPLGRRGDARRPPCARAQGGPRHRLSSIATYRDDELDRTHPLRIVLGELATTDGVTRMALEPLSPEGVVAAGAGPRSRRGRALPPDRRATRST